MKGTSEIPRLAARSRNGMDGSADSSPVRSWQSPQPFSKVLSGARSGDEDCFVVLWRWLQPALLGWLRIVAPGAEEEAAAETWVSVTRGLERFQGEDSEFRSWVFTIARRRACDEHRTRKRLAEPADLQQHEAPAPGADPSIEVTENMASEDAVALLRQLPPMQGHVVTLRVVAGLSVSETAEAVGKSEGAVRVLCHRGLQSLAALMAAEEAVAS